MSNIDYSKSNMFDVVSKLMYILSSFVDFTISNAPVLLKNGLSENADHDHHFAHASLYLPIVLCGDDGGLPVHLAAHSP